MNDELLEELEMILKSTANIQKCLNKLSSLELLSDTFHIDYSEAKSKLLEVLNNILDYENSGYDFLEEAEDIEETLEFLDEHDLNQVNQPCLNRMQNYLSNSLLKKVVTNYDDDTINDYISNEFLTYITINRQFTTDEMRTFITELLPTLNKSLIKHFMINMNNEIKKETNFKRKRKLTDLKYNILFEQGKGLELDVINNNLTGNIENEIKLSNIEPTLKNDLLVFEIMNNLYNNIVILSSCLEEDISLEELVWFKTYSLYLNNDMLKSLTEYIANYNFQNETIKNKLIDYLNNINDYKKLHNQESKSYQK